jgi:serine kinase of HPr protein (carbohydrate metabolism regulator)
MILHAGLIALHDGGRWRGVLVEGPSGAGKSDLALRALDAGWALVADDRTLVWANEGRLFGRAAPALAGLIEVRGVGVIGRPRRDFARVELIVRCVAEGPLERAPEFQARDVQGVAIPQFELIAWEASAPAKLASALRYL